MRYIISPHLDDAVLSCSAVLLANPASTVITVFGGDPPARVALTAWDRQCGFAASSLAQPSRRREDRAALKLLGARPIWLDFQDHQYGYASPTELIVAALDRAIPHNAIVFGPLGLTHPDHIQVASACRSLQRDQPGSRIFYAYADVPYRASNNGRELAAKLPSLQTSGVSPVACTGLHDSVEQKAKLVALGRYASQLVALKMSGLDMDDCVRPEQFWRLTRYWSPSGLDFGRRGYLSVHEPTE